MAKVDYVGQLWGYAAHLDRNGRKAALPDRLRGVGDRADGGRRRRMGRRTWRPVCAKAI